MLFDFYLFFVLYNYEISGHKLYTQYNINKKECVKNTVGMVQASWFSGQPASQSQHVMKSKYVIPPV